VGRVSDVSPLGGKRLNSSLGPSKFASSVNAMVLTNYGLRISHILFLLWGACRAECIHEIWNTHHSCFQCWSKYAKSIFYCQEKSSNSRDSSTALITASWSPQIPQSNGVFSPRRVRPAAGVCTWEQYLCLPTLSLSSEMDFILTKYTWIPPCGMTEDLKMKTSDKHDGTVEGGNQGGNSRVIHTPHLLRDCRTFLVPARNSAGINFRLQNILFDLCRNKIPDGFTQSDFLANLG